jgi:Mg-chelatase subunit ChlD
MSTEFPSNPREELEASLTALLLGELPEDEAKRLRDLLATDADLARTCERLKQAIEMVRVAEVEPAVAVTSASPAPKLSEGRRQQLLQKFKTIEPAEFAGPKVSWVHWLLPAGIAALLLAVLSYSLLTSVPERRIPAMMTLDTAQRQSLLAGNEKRAQPAQGLDERATDRDVNRKSSSDQQAQQLARLRNLTEHTDSAASTESFAKLENERGLLRSGGIGGAATATSPTVPTSSGGDLAAAPPLQEPPLARSETLQSFGDDASNQNAFTRYYGLAQNSLTDNKAAGREAGSKAGEASQTLFYAKDAWLDGTYVTNGADASGLPMPQAATELASQVDTLTRRGEIMDAAGKSTVPQLGQEVRTDKGQPRSTTLGDEPVLGRLFKETAEDSERLAEKAKVDQAKPGAKAPSTPPVIALNGGFVTGLAGQREKLVEQLKPALLRSELKRTEQDVGLVRSPAPPPVPQPEIGTRENAFSTFSLNVSDVSYKLAAASLEHNQMPEAASIRAEEFINAFDYHDPEPAPGAPFAFAWERARYPFAQKRDLLRLSLKAAAQGREAGRPLNVVLLLDNSGSMERADRVRILHEALRILANQLQPQDTLSVVTFARTARLWVDGIAGDKAGQVADEVGGLTPEGGTNLEEAMNLGYQTAVRHYQAGGINRVVLLTDGAANLGDVDAAHLKEKVEANRKQGIALDCFGIGWDGYNDELLETLSRNGDGRYGFLNSPEEAATRFATQLAGALHTAAADVKVQVEFNPDRVTAYRQIGYAKHQLTKEQFRDNSVDAAELAAAESGNALYVLDVNAGGTGPLATVRVRFKVPGTTEYRESAWTVPYDGSAVSLDQAKPGLRLAGAAGAFAEWLSSSPFAAEVTSDALLHLLNGVPEAYGADARPGKLESMVRQAKSITGR